MPYPGDNVYNSEQFPGSGIDGNQTHPGASRINQQSPYSRQLPLLNQAKPYAPGQEGLQSNYQTNYQSTTNQQTQTNDILSIQLTPEDMMFMRNYKHDVMVKRCLPFAAIGCSGLYLYNKHNHLPHRVFKYLGVGFAAYVFGLLSFKGELIRRVSESNSQTPFMQAFKRRIGATSSGNFDVSSVGFDPYKQLPTDNYGANYELSPDYTGEPIGQTSSKSDYDPFAQPSGSNYGDPSYKSGLSSLQPNAPSDDRYTTGFGTMSDDQKRDEQNLVSYEELRARNRGLIR